MQVFKLITGGDSGIGRAVAVAFAKEGADLAISYLYEEDDAKYTKDYVEKYGARCLLIEGDISSKEFCHKIIDRTIKHFGKLDILINNAGVQWPHDNGIECISQYQLELTYKVNIFPMFYLVQAALPHLKSGSAIINTASVTAYKGPENLIDYASTKGAVVTFTRSLSNSLIKKGIRVNAVAPGPIWTPLIVSSYSLIDYASTKGAVVTFTRSLSNSLIKKGIRVNAVAPGPIWTPLIVSSYSADKMATFGLDVPMKRAGQPYELAPTYVYLASEDSSYVTGQVLHVNGGTMVDS